MINAQQAIELAERIVAEQGADFVYAPGGDNCYNVPLPVVREQTGKTSTPRPSDPREYTGCLVGRILSAAGETRHQQGRFVGYSIFGLVNVLKDIATVRASWILHTMQTSQDNGDSWGAALALAKEAVAAGKYDHLSDDALGENERAEMASV